MIPKDLRYHSEHEWIRREGESAVLGITHYAQDSLGDVVYLELPKPDDSVSAGQEIGEVESTKTASPIYSPVSGTVTEVNDDLTDQPELVNQDPYGKGWIVKIRLSNPSEVDQLMDSGQYEAYLKEQSD